MKNQIRTGILSFGMSGKLFHAPFIKAHPGFELAAVVERSKKKAQIDFPDIISYDAVDELLADPSIELVVVNTPNATHFEFALKAIKAGKHVLVEKPFTVDSAEAKQLFEVSKTHNRFVLPYQNRRYDSDFIAVRQVIDSGKLGRLVEVHLRYDRYRHHIGPKVQKETPVPGSGLMYDLAPHLLDIVISLFDIPLKWTKTLGHFRPHTQVDDYAHIHLIYPEEIQIFLTMSLLVTDPQIAFILHGTRGTYIGKRADIQEKQLLQGMSPNDPQFGIEDSGVQGVLTTISEEGLKTQEQIAPEKSSYLHLFEAVYQTIRAGIPYPITEPQIIQQIEILEG